MLKIERAFNKSRLKKCIMLEAFRQDEKRDNRILSKFVPDDEVIPFEDQDDLEHILRWAFTGYEDIPSDGQKGDSRTPLEAMLGDGKHPSDEEENNDRISLQSISDNYKITSENKERVERILP